MEWNKRLSIFKWRPVNSKMNISFLISTYFHLFYYFRIVRYETTYTEDSVYIIGGFTWGTPSRISTIAQYKDDIWTIAGNLKQTRSSRGAITVKGKTMIIGGYPQSGTT